MEEWFQTVEIESGLWALVESHTDSVTSYLVEGSERALLIDTGLGIGDIRVAIGELTEKPVSVVNTHAHYDHIGGNRLFDDVSAHPDASVMVEKGVPAERLAWLVDPGSFLADPPLGFSTEGFAIPPTAVSHLLDEGDEMALGGRAFRVLHTPGHAAGCISLFDDYNKVLFSGDMVYPGNLFVCFPDSDFEEYCESIGRIAALSSQIRLLLPAHGPFPLDVDFVRRLGDWLHDVVAGRVASSVSGSPWGTVRVYEGPEFNLLLRP